MLKVSRILQAGRAETLAKVNELIARATTPGERECAMAARDRLLGSQKPVSKKFLRDCKVGDEFSAYPTFSAVDEETGIVDEDYQIIRRILPWEEMSPVVKKYGPSRMFELELTDPDNLEFTWRSPFDYDQEVYVR